MIPPFPRNASSLEGKLIVEEEHPNCVQVFFISPEEKLTRPVLDSTKLGSYRVKLLRVSGQDNLITIYPTNTFVGHEKFLKSKYKQVKRITLVGFDFSTPEDSDSVIDLLRQLPPGFSQNYNYGLGLLKDYRFIVQTIEELSDCTEIVIARDVSTGIDKQDSTIFAISYKDFESARKSVDRIADEARELARLLKENRIYNLFAACIGEREKPVQLEKNFIRLVARASKGDEYLEVGNREPIVNLSRNVKAIAETKPESLAKLKNDIELVTLQILIERYEVMLGQKLKEDRWQVFFNENQFILSLAFGYPLVMVKDQASVGGRKLSGSGEKIADYLVKNSLTNNTALFEIKTPQAKLLKKTPHREGLFAPSPDLSSSINQALDQRYQFQKQIAYIKDTSRIQDIETYAVHSCLIIGTTPTGIDQQKSFELFRCNSKSVQIVTFDELLEKLRQLHGLLAAGDENAAAR